MSSLEPVRLRSLFQSWTNQNRPLIINIYFSPFNENKRILLEKWKISLNKNEDDSSSRPNQQLSQFISGLRTLIRSVACSLKNLPTYRFLCQTNQGISSFALDFDDPDFENDIAFDSCKINQFEFKNIDVLFGYTYVKVCYREDCSSLIPKKLVNDIEIIDDYVPSSRSDNSFSNSNSSYSSTGDSNNKSDNIDIPITSKRISPLSSPTKSSPFLSVGAKAFKNSPKSVVLSTSTSPQHTNLQDLFLGADLVQKSSVESNSPSSESSSLVKSDLKGSDTLHSSSFQGKPLFVSPFREKSVLQDGSIVLDSSSSNSFSETSFLFLEGLSSTESLSQSEFFTNSLSDEVGEFLTFCEDTKRNISSRYVSNVASTLKELVSKNLN